MALHPLCCILKIPAEVAIFHLLRACNRCSVLRFSTGISCDFTSYSFAQRFFAVYCDMALPVHFLLFVLGVLAIPAEALANYSFSHDLLLKRDFAPQTGVMGPSGSLPCGSDRQCGRESMLVEAVQFLMNSI